MMGIGANTKRRVEIFPLQSQPPPLLHKPPPPPPHFSTTFYRAILLAAAVGLMYIVLNQSDFSPPANQISSPSVDRTQPNQPLERDGEASSFHVFKSQVVRSEKGEKNDKLESILKKAAMKDGKTVIITTVNAVWAEPSSIFDLFLESFKIGNGTEKFLDNLVVVAMDQKAYYRCLSLDLHCYALTTDGVDFSGEARFMSGDYLKMMWRRTEFLVSVLEMGYNFIFSDVDIVWMRDPFERLYPDIDFQIACDVYLNNSTNRKNYANGGFLYVKSTPLTIQLYTHWLDRGKAFPKENEQDVFYRIKGGTFLDEIGLDIRFLDTTYISGLCDPSRDLDVVVTMHANCCTSLKNKIHDMKMLIEDWKNYRMGRGDKKWTVPRKCGVREATLKKMKAIANT